MFSGRTKAPAADALGDGVETGRLLSAGDAACAALNALLLLAATVTPLSRETVKRNTDSENQGNL